MSKIARFFRNTGQVTSKDLKDFVRNRPEIIAFLIMPFFMMVMVGFIYPSQSSIKNVRVGIVNLDGGPASTLMVDTLGKIKAQDSSKPLMLLNTVADKGKVKELIQKQSLSGAIVISKGFSKDTEAGRSGKVTLITDQSNPQVSSMLSGMLGTVFDGMSKQVANARLRQLDNGKLSADAIQGIVSPLTVTSESTVPGKPNYFEFVAPGIMAMVAMMAVLMGLAGSVAREKEGGTLDGILVAPISRFSIIAGKTGAQTVRGLIQGGIVLLLSVAVFHVKIYGSFLLMLLVLILGIFSFVGLGILISAAVEDQETAMTIMMTLTFPMLFLSGALFPIEQMPGFMQAVSKLIPLSYEVSGLRQVIVLGAGIGDVIKPILVLLTFGLVMLFISIPVFNRVLTR